MEAERKNTQRSFIYMSVCVQVLRLEEGIEFPRVGVTVDCETPDACVLGSKLSQGTAKAAALSLQL